MKVKYLGSHHRLVGDASIPGTGTKLDSHIPLTANRVYDVDAVAFRQTVVRFYIVDDDELPYPLAYDAEQFAVVDDRIPSHWHFAYTPEHKDHRAIMGIKEWVSDEFFYDRLTDGSLRERTLIEMSRSKERD